MERGGLRVETENFRPNLGEVVHDRLVVNIGLLDDCWLQTVGTTGHGQAAQIGKSLALDSLKSEVGQLVEGLGTASIVVPVLLFAMDEDGKWVEFIVVIHDVGEVGTGFMTVDGIGDEEAFFGLFFQGIDVGCAATK